MKKMSWGEINKKFVNPAKQLMYQGKYSEAEKLLLEGYSLTKDGWIAYHLGELFFRVEQLEEAIKYYELAENLMPYESFKEKARKGKLRVENFSKGGIMPLSWIEINQTYIYPSHSKLNPHDAINLLQEGYKKTQDGWVAFHLAERYLEINERDNAEKYYRIAVNSVPLTRYKEIAQNRLNALKTPKPDKKLSDSSIKIKDVIGPNEVSSDNPCFDISLTIMNQYPDPQIVKIWFYAMWPNGGAEQLPAFKLPTGSTTKNITVPTPEKDGKHIVEIQLLDEQGILLPDQMIQIPFEMKLSGKSRLLKWGKYLGMIIFTRF